MPKVSVVMPVYNGEKYLRDAIDSILNQTYKDYEFIIINDGSTDKTEDIILSYHDSRIVYLKNEVNSKIVVTLNKGLDYASGEYIVRMDADDISMPERIEKQVQYMDKHSDIAVLGTAIKIFGDNTSEQVRTFSTKPHVLKVDLLFASCIAHPTVIMRKKILDQLGLRYDENFVGIEDYHLWWNIADKGNITTLLEPLLYYRIHPNQSTQQYTDKSRKIFESFLEMRLNKIQVHLTESEKKCFFRFCCGESWCFDKDAIKLFTDIVNLIIKKNNEVGYFDPNALRNACGSAVMGLLNNAQITNDEKKECYQYSAKLYSWLRRLKVFCRGILG